MFDRAGHNFCHVNRGTEELVKKKSRNFRTPLFDVTAVHGVCQNPLCFQIIVWVKIIASK